METRKRHIGVLCTTHALGGMELNLLRLAGWMKQRGWGAVALGLSDAPFVSHAGEFGLDTASVPAYRKYFDFSGAKALASVLQDLQVEVLILSSNRDVNTAVLARQFFYPELKVIYLQQMQLGIAKKDIAHTWQYRRLDAWIAPLEWLAEQARKNTRVQHAKVHVIPLCIEMARFTDAAEKKAQARGILDLPQEAFIIGTVGRYDEGKQQEVLIRAAGALSAGGSPVDVLLVGEDTRDEKQNYGAFLKRLAAELGIADRVHFRPFRSDVETAYAAMDAFAMTTPSETFGMVTVEAMASGVPVIAANGGGSPELLHFGSAGLLVPPKDTAALSEAISELHANPGRRAELAGAARSRAMARYAHMVQCEQTEALIASLYD